MEVAEARQHLEAADVWELKGGVELTIWSYTHRQASRLFCRRLWPESLGHSKLFVDDICGPFLVIALLRRSCRQNRKPKRMLRPLNAGSVEHHGVCLEALEGPPQGPDANVPTRLR